MKNEVALFTILLITFIALGCASTKTASTKPKSGNPKIASAVSDKAFNQKFEMRKYSGIDEEDYLNMSTIDKSSKKNLNRSAYKDTITPKNIQIALKKANYYNGSIDGKIGRGTKKAIKEFQKANGLKVDGEVGKKTWEKLKIYLR